MKKVSVLIPCYNEEENVVPMSDAVVSLFENELPQYDYELLTMIHLIIQERFCGRYVKITCTLRQYSMQKILDSLIRPIMEFFRQRETAL